MPPRNVLLIVFLIYLGVIASIRVLYEFRGIPWIGDHLSTGAAVLMVYPAILHIFIRKISLPFFEKEFSKLLDSLKIFLLASLIIFPFFLIGNHFYQTILLGHVWTGGGVADLSRFLAVQLFLVAIPEEFFFRGWLQGILSRHFPARRAILLTAVLFAVAHSAITLRWWHFAIFFPGLVFGWLREKTGHITASILFHAVSNILAAWIAQNYR